jgi:lactoylglutathione lyase
LVSWPHINREERYARDLAFRDAFPIFHTADLLRAAAFYSERLGFEERYRFPEAGAPAFVLVGLGPFSLGLTRVDQIEPAGRAALWLYCDDVDAEIEALRKAGVEIVREPNDMEWGERMATVLDPDGNEIYVAQRSSGVGHTSRGGDVPAP